MPSLAEVARQFRKIVDDDVRLSRYQAFLASQPVSDATGNNAGPFARLHVRVSITDDDRMGRLDSKTVEHVVNQGGMWFFLRRAVAAENRVKLFLDTQTAQYRYGESMHFVTHDNPTLVS